jgi:hypothetical protein
MNNLVLPKEILKIVSDYINLTLENVDDLNMETFVFVHDFFNIKIKEKDLNMYLSKCIQNKQFKTSKWISDRLLPFEKVFYQEPFQIKINLLKPLQFKKTGILTDSIPKDIRLIIGKYMDFKYPNINDGNYEIFGQLNTLFRPKIDSKFYSNIVDNLLKKSKFKSAKFLIDNFKIKIPRVIYLNNFGRACFMRSIHFAKWIDSLISITDEEAITVLQTILFDGTVLENMCLNGGIKIFKWYTKKFNISTSFIKRKRLLNFACTNGNLSLVKYLIKTHYKDETVEKLAICVYANLRNNNYRITNFLLARIIELNKRELLNFYLDDFKHDYEDILYVEKETEEVRYNIGKNAYLKYEVSVEPNDSLLDTSVKYKDNILDIIYIVKTFNPPYMNVDRLEMFKIACTKGMLESAIWFYRNFFIKDYHIELTPLFRDICVNGHLDVAKWFAKKFNLNRDQVETKTISIYSQITGGENDYSLHKTLRNYNYNIIGKWLCETFDLFDVKNKREAKLSASPI